MDFHIHSPHLFYIFPHLITTSLLRLTLDLYLAYSMRVSHSVMSTLCDPVDYGLPGFSVHGIFQTRILELAAIPFSRGSSQPRDQIWVSCITGRLFTIWATRKALKMCWGLLKVASHSPFYLSLFEKLSTLQLLSSVSWTGLLDQLHSCHLSYPYRHFWVVLINY